MADIGTLTKRKIERIQKLADDAMSDIDMYMTGYPQGGDYSDRMCRVRERMEAVSASCEHALANLNGGL